MILISLFRTHVRIGTSNLAANSYQITRKVAGVFLHPNYVIGVGYYDIAILETEFIPFSDFIGPICLPSHMNQNFEDKFDGKAVVLVGWGSSHIFGRNSENLKRVSIEVVPFR